MFYSLIYHQGLGQNVGSFHILSDLLFLCPGFSKGRKHHTTGRQNVGTMWARGGEERLTKMLGGRTHTVEGAWSKCNKEKKMWAWMFGVE